MFKLKIYNTITNQKETFNPVDSKHVRMYTCGPTVYNYAHIGNARPAIISDILVQIIYFFMYINIALAVFNMLPITPLDGSQIFGNLISKNNPDLAWKLQMYGPKILFGLILIGIVTPFSILGTIMMPFIKIFMFLFAGL